MKLILLFKSSELAAGVRKTVGVTEAAKRRGWRVQLIEPVGTAREVRDLLDFWHPDGCIVSCGTSTNAFPPSAFGRTPVVFIDRPSRALRPTDVCVYHNSTATSQMAARVLLSLNLESYAFVTWKGAMSWSEERRAAFADILRLHGRKLALLRADHPPSSECALPQEIADGLAALPRPVGVLAATDQMAAKVIAACRLAKLSIPTDVALVGIDNDENLCEATTPTLSSVEPDFASAGRLAVEALEKLMSGRGRGARLVYAPLRFVPRESSRRLMRVDHVVSRALERIRREACSGLSARTVLADFPCSRRMAEMRFRALVGRSVLQEIRAVRLDKAKELLRTSHAPLDAIANWCGYKSAIAFTLFFKSETGIAPTAFRKR